MYRRTVRGDTRIPSFTSSSDAIRSWPHPRFAAAMSAINCRRSAGNRGRPRGLDFHRQNSRNPFRCHRMSVSGFTTVRSRRRSISRDSAASVTRVASSARRGFTCRSTYNANSLRRKRFSAARCARERNIDATNCMTLPATRATVRTSRRDRGPGHASGWYATDARGDLPLRGHGIRLGAASSGPNSGQILPGWTFADHSPSVWLISRFHREGEAKDYGFR